MVKHGTGNWQRRVEATEARRAAARIRRKTSGEMKTCKRFAQDCLQMVQRHFERLSPNIIHIWTDKLPIIEENDVETNDLDEEVVHSLSTSIKKRSVSLGNQNDLPKLASPRARKGRGRSNSFVEGRCRSNSFQEGPGKKKLHPRSKESFDETLPEDIVYICRSHFFTGKCNECRRKNGECRYQNGNSSIDQTLYQILAKRDTKVQDMNVHSNGYIESDAPVGAMQATFYNAYTVSEDDDEDNFVACITEFLSRRQIKLSNIVFMVLDDLLIFDRAQDGLIFKTDKDFLIAFLGEGFIWNRRESFVSDDDELAVLRLLPGTILEYVLTFLPDEAVAATAAVCKAWHHEIGKTPNLWKHMLNRHDWPHPPKSDNQQDHKEYKKQFLAHYSVIRDLKGIQSGIAAIVDQRKTAGKMSKEMAYQDFSTRSNAPSQTNLCIGLWEWSPNRILAAYYLDCTLRLFETVTKPGESGEKLCRELICQIVDVYRNTKKRQSRLVSTGLDDECIGCLCHVMSENVEIGAEAYLLVIMSREDFLLGDSSEMLDTVTSAEELSYLNVIDIGEAVLNYLLSLDVADHRLLQLIDFLSYGGNIGEVEVLATHSILACGHGRFMLEVSISIPRDTEEDNDSMRMIDRKLFIFSSHVGAIVWMGESNFLAHDLRPRREEMILSNFRSLEVECGTRTSCVFAVGSSSSPAIVVGEISSSGEVSDVKLVEASLMARNEITANDWEIDGVRPILVTSTDIIVADVLVRQQIPSLHERKVIVSTYPRNASTEGVAYRTLVIDGNMNVIQMACFREQYLVLMCRESPIFNDHHENAGGFGVTAPNQHLHQHVQTSPDQYIVAVLLHLPSHREIARIPFPNGEFQNQCQAMQMIEHCSDTIGVGFSGKGIVMAGVDIRSAAIDSSMRSTKREKKKRRQVRGSKKDGFQRGTSLFG